MNTLPYIANQLTPEGLDEIQRVLLAHRLGQHVAIAGAPGTGKTHLITLIPAISGQQLYEISCDEQMSEAPIIGYPDLEGRNGATVQVWKNGTLTHAMEEGGISYQDEIDLLPRSVQKRQNPAHDDRRRVTRRDGKLIEAKPEFRSYVSYNPSDKLSKHELEPAVADRFVHLTFGYLPAPLMAAIATGDYSGLSLEERAIKWNGDLQLCRKNGSAWVSHYTGQPLSPAETLWAYKAFVPAAPHVAAGDGLGRTSLAKTLADFMQTTRHFAEAGTADLSSEITSYLGEIGSVTSVPLHKPSVRILKAAIAQYDALRELGMPGRAAQQYATRLVIDQICYGKYGLRPLDGAGKFTTRDAVTKLAEHYKLLDAPGVRTDL